MMNIYDATETAYKNGYGAGAKELEAKNKELDEKLLIYRGTIDWQAKEIKRQKAEIEKYEHIKTTINKVWDILLKQNLAKRKAPPTLEEFEGALREIEAETRKDFAERLKEVGTKVEGGKGFEGIFVMANNLQIDKLLEEMAGE